MFFFVSFKVAAHRGPRQTPSLRLLGCTDGRVDWSVLAPGYILPGFAITPTLVCGHKTPYDLNPTKPGGLLRIFSHLPSLFFDHKPKKKGFTLGTVNTDL